MLEGWWTALMVVGVWAAGAEGESARLRQRTNPGLSSSTLEWLDAEAGQPLPPDALLADENVGVWCRFNDHGTVAGVVRDGVCHAPFLETVVSSKKYEALISINDSARIVEVEWSRSAAPSTGGVEVSKDRLLALARTPEGTVLPGFVDTEDRLAYLLNGSQAEIFEDAVILTEVEPSLYELDGVVWDDARAVLNAEDHVLCNITLENPEAEAQLVAETIEYTETEALYWGNIRGTAKGLNATVTGPGGQVWEVTWGIRSEFKRVVQQEVSLEVPAGASVEVVLVGVIHMYESPYTAQLTAVYWNETRRARPVAALHQHEYLAELRADFGRPQSLADGQELEGDFPTSEVLIASTTTTTTTTTIPPPPGTDPGAEQAGSLATPKTSLAAGPPALPPPLLACCLALLVRLARP